MWWIPVLSPEGETSSIRLVLILGAAGIFEISKAIGPHHLTAAAVAWLAVSLMAGAVMGAIRAATVRIWRAQDGSAWRQGTMITGALWLISLAAHLALDTIIDHASRMPTLGTSSILLYLAVTLGIQREIVRRRTAPLAPAERHDPGWTPPSRSATGDRLNQVPARADWRSTGPRSVHACLVWLSMRVSIPQPAQVPLHIKGLRISA